MRRLLMPLYSSMAFSPTPAITGPERAGEARVRRVRVDGHVRQHCSSLLSLRRTNGLLRDFHIVRKPEPPSVISVYKAFHSETTHDVVKIFLGKGNLLIASSLIEFLGGVTPRLSFNQAQDFRSLEVKASLRPISALTKEASRSRWRSGMSTRARYIPFMPRLMRRSF
jgi:hypothetical protein